MAYSFTNQEVAEFKFTDLNSEALTLKGVNGSESDANVIVNGIMALLHIGGIEDNHNPLTAYRQVKQDVNDEY